MTITKLIKQLTASGEQRITIERGDWIGGRWRVGIAMRPLRYGNTLREALEDALE